MKVNCIELDISTWINHIKLMVEINKYHLFDINLVKFPVIIISNISFLSLFLLILVFPLHIYCMFPCCPTILGYSVLFFSLFFVFLVWDVFIEISLNSGILSSVVSSFLVSSSKAFFNSILVVFITSVYFCLFLGFAPLCLYCPSVPACCLLYSLEP